MSAAGDMAARLSQATAQLLCATGDPLAELQHLEAGDAGFEDAQLLRMAVAVIAKTPAALVELRSVLESQERPSGRRARMHWLAARDWLDGRPLRAIDRYAAVLERWPGDLLALRLALSCCFFCGEHARALEISNTALQRGDPRGAARAHVLAMAAFAHAEAGDAERAEWFGRAALRNNPDCPAGVHALAHAFEAAGRSRAGAAWMRQQRAQWAVPSRMCTHNAWHLAMFDVAEGRAGSALMILDRILLPAADEQPLDACDAAGLLWQLVSQGVAVGDRWERLSARFERLWQGGFWPYVDLHAGFTHALAGREQRLRLLTSTVASRLPADDYAAQRAREITLPGLDAMSSWLQGDVPGAQRALANLQPRLLRAGGSHAQWRIFQAGAPEASFKRAERSGALPPPRRRDWRVPDLPAPANRRDSA